MHLKDKFNIFFSKMCRIQRNVSTYVFSSGHAYERETSGTTEETGATDATDAIGVNGVKMVRLSRIPSFTTSVGVGPSTGPTGVSSSVGAE